MNERKTNKKTCAKHTLLLNEMRSVVDVISLHAVFLKLACMEQQDYFEVLSRMTPVEKLALTEWKRGSVESSA